MDEAADTSSNWLDDAALNELSILTDFIEKGFALDIDTSHFIQHSEHPYAPFSTGAYNDLVDQINGLEGFFGHWKKTRENAIDTLSSWKATAKANVYAEVFEGDCPALSEYAENLIRLSSDAAKDAVKKGDEDLAGAKDLDMSAREQIQTKLNKEKTKLFREIGYLAKKMYRATREEYKEEIKIKIEEAIETMAEKITEARMELAEYHEESYYAENLKDQ